eukprot:UN24006
MKGLKRKSTFFLGKVGKEKKVGKKVTNYKLPWVSLRGGFMI